MKIPEHYIPAKDPVGDFAQDILRVRNKGVIRFFAGFANPHLYDHPLIEQSLRHAAHRGADIRVQVGPALLRGRDGSNSLWQLFQEGVISDLKFRTCRGLVLNLEL